jgi:hypothetical protein
MAGCDGVVDKLKQAGRKPEGIVGTANQSARRDILAKNEAGTAVGGRCVRIDWT